MRVKVIANNLEEQEIDFIYDDCMDEAYHDFEEGEIVTLVAEDGTEDDGSMYFVTECGNHGQWLHPEHYEQVEHSYKLIGRSI